MFNHRHDWDKLKSDIKTHGIRNSLLLAPMSPNTSQILGNNECLESCQVIFMLEYHRR